MNVVAVHNLPAQDALTYANESNSKTGVVEKEKPQVFEFRGYDRGYELEKISKEMAGEHPFGDLIAKKIYLLEEKYTSEVALVPGNPQTRIVIIKPVIYEAVKRIEKHLIKSVKKEETNLTSASYTLNKILDVALNILTADTQGFEAAISSLNTNDSRIELFTQRVNLVF